MLLLCVGTSKKAQGGSRKKASEDSTNGNGNAKPSRWGRRRGHKAGSFSKVNYENGV